MENPVNVLGVPVTGWQPPDLIEHIVQWASSGGDPKTLLYANVHVLNTAYRHPDVHAALLGATTVYCDGSGVRLGAMLLGRSLPERFTAADWMDIFCKRAIDLNLSIYFLAGAPGVAERAAALLVRQHPGLRIEGTHHGFPDTAASERIVEETNRRAIHIVFVGMGTPYQERWIRQYRHRLAAPVVWGVGGLFDVITGVQARPSKWLTDYHLEWFGRLLQHPRRLAGRYLIGNPLFCLRVVRQRVLGLPKHLNAAT